MAKLTYATALLGALSVVNGMPSQLSKREILRKLPENANGVERQFQPFLDFDNDGCYQTAAIDPDGKLNEGKRIGGAVNGQCHDEAQLVNSNTYSRSRCNNGVCGIVYEYYYEKDQVGDGASSFGHKHDFENVVVFTRDNDVLRVAPSCHGEYENARNNPDEEFADGVLLDGGHPLVVYHKDAGSTHCHRLATEEDRDNPENVYGGFFKADLVGWDGFPNEGLRTSLTTHDWSPASIKTRDADFANTLAKAGAALVGLDPNYDG